MSLSEYVVGKLAVDQILWADAQTDGVSLFEVCDNDSQGPKSAQGPTYTQPSQPPKDVIEGRSGDEPGAMATLRPSRGSHGWATARYRGVQTRR